MIGQAIALRPDYAEAHNNLGNVLVQQGKQDEAAVAFRRALDLKPDYADAHNNLGNLLRGQGKLDEAVAAFCKALVLKPDYADAHSNLGIARKDQGNLDEAVAAFRKALALKPYHADAHSSLGHVLRDQGKLDEAAAAFRKVLELQPDHADAHNDLGNVLSDQGKFKAAAAVYQRALALKPDYPEAHNNLGITLKRQGRLEDAVAAYEKALVLNPDYPDAHNNLGYALLHLGRFGDAKAAFHRVLTLNHGGPWWNAATFDEAARAAAVPPAKAPTASTFKLRDTIDQIEYLMGKGCIDPSFARMAERYRAVLDEIQRRDGPDAAAKLNAAQTASLGAFYDRVVHYADAPRLDGGVINPSLDFKRIEDAYLASPVSVTAFDDFLTPEALRALRNFCLESTIFFNHTGVRFVSGRLHSGFNCDVLYQMAEELKACLPRVLSGHALRNMWVYRYRNESEGVAAHTDEGAVTFNFWITPDEANLDPGRGGLVVYAREQPADWDWRYYNTEKYTPAVSREIANFLADAETVTIPYRENRSVLFHSNLFHKSDTVRFRDGFENRRMNVTMLFGERDVS